MNAGELVVSLILSAGAFKAQVQNAQKGLDGVQAAAVDAGRATYDPRTWPVCRCRLFVAGRF